MYYSFIIICDLLLVYNMVDIPPFPPNKQRNQVIQHRTKQYNKKVKFYLDPKVSATEFSGVYPQVSVPRISVLAILPVFHHYILQIFF